MGAGPDTMDVPAPGSLGQGWRRAELVRNDVHAQRVCPGFRGGALRFVQYLPARDRPLGRLYPRGSLVAGLPRAVRHELLAPTRHHLDMKAAHMSIFSHYWRPTDPLDLLVMTCPDRGRERLAGLAGFPPGGRTMARGKTKAGQQLAKWLYRVVLYCATGQLQWLVRAQGGHASPGLVEFSRRLQANAAAWVLAQRSQVSAPALYTLLEHREAAVMSRLRHKLRECYGDVSQVLLGDGMYVEYHVPVEHLAALAGEAGRECHLPQCRFTIDAATEVAPWHTPTPQGSTGTPRFRRRKRLWQRLGHTGAPVAKRARRG